MPDPKEDPFIRRLRYRFLNLQYPQRLQIALDLHLVQNHDEGVSAGTSFERYLQRAIERKIIDQLEDAINQWHTQIARVGSVAAEGEGR